MRAARTPVPVLGTPSTGSGRCGRARDRGARPHPEAGTRGPTALLPRTPDTAAPDAHNRIMDLPPRTPKRATGAPLRVTYPLYQPVMEVDGAWLTLRSPSESPQEGRDELVNHFCCRAREREDDPARAHEYREFADAEILLSWEAHDEVRVLGRGSSAT